MMAGGKDLRFTLPDDVDGFNAGHKDWRIVVEGAGVDGGRLITSVEAVPEPKSRLVLKDEALVDITSTTATLNEPGAVLLDDHARATIGPLTVQLHNRPITGSMKVGSFRLASADADFSADDLGRAAVVIEGAGHHVTRVTGISADDAAEMTVDIADVAVRPVGGGTAAVWDPEQDALPRLLDLIEAVRDAGPGPHEIEFAPGVYDFKRPPEQPGEMDAVIRLQHLTGVTIRGAGLGATVLRLMPEQNLRNSAGNVMDTHVVMARDCTHLSISDLSVDAAYLNMQRAVEQMHSIFISEGCRLTRIADVGVVHSAGDAVRLLGEPGNPVQGVHVERCQLVQAKRSGVAVQRSVKTATIRDCTIEMSPPSTGSCLDFEPSGEASEDIVIEDFVIESNVFVHNTNARAISLSGTGVGPATRGIRFIGNVLDGGGIGGVNCQDVTISDNVITAGTDNAFSLDGFDDLTISGNRITVEAPGAAGIPRWHGVPPVESHNVNIHDNVLTVTGPGHRHLERRRPHRRLLQSHRGLRIRYAGGHRACGSSARPSIATSASPTTRSPASRWPASAWSPSRQTRTTRSRPSPSWASTSRAQLPARRRRRTASRRRGDQPPRPQPGLAAAGSHQRQPHRREHHAVRSTAASSPSQSAQTPAKRPSTRVR